VTDGSWTPPTPPDLRFDPDAFWADDPPIMSCVSDGGMLPPPPIPGGTPECPDDKNRQGCPCTTVGEQRACWPGLRQNRNLGICRDGVTTCMRVGELNQALVEAFRTHRIEISFPQRDVRIVGSVVA
jgi:hypothetical protein